MSKSIAEIRAMAAAFHDGAAGFDNTTRLNAYECDGEKSFSGNPDKPGCGAYIVTVDREPGVTPFMVKCELCGQMAHSKFYRVQASLVPTHEWYRPDSLTGLNPYELEHVEKGGLLLRSIDGAAWTANNIISDIEEMKRHADRARHLELLKASLANEIEPRKLDSKIKREDYANRQQYRAAVRDERKPNMKPRGFA